jgi:hypothetical protein
MLNRESGSLCSWGSSQASALTATTTPGGKAGRSPAARSLLESGEALLEETLARTRRRKKRAVVAYVR